MTQALAAPADRRVNVLGIGVSAITMADAIATIEDWIANRKQRYVCIAGVHGVMESQRNAALRRIHNRAGMVTPDGMPLVWMAHLQGMRHVERVYGPDLMLEMCARSAGRGIRHYFYGGGEGTADALKAALVARFPGLEVVDTLTPPFRPMSPAEDEEAVKAINSARPDIVWVGLSTPKQELWMADHAGRVSAPVLIGVGAAFDFLSGKKRQAPRWMQRNGLEWLFRMATEPRRLAGRYLRNNPAFLMLAAAQLLALRRYGNEWNQAG